MTRVEEPAVPVDTAGPVRAEEALDRDRLSAYLRERLTEFEGPLEITQFPHGHSNLTYLLRGGAGEYVLRRPPFGNRVPTAHDMVREHRILTALVPVFPLAPRPVLLCEDARVIGAPFYLMERRSGIILRARLPSGLDLSPSQADRLCEAFVSTLASLHRLDYRTLGLEGFGRPEGYVERQVAGWGERFRGAKTADVPEMDAVAAWLVTHRPGESGAGVVHNDFKFDNLVLDPSDISRPLAVLDWEMATIGDPLLDLGTTLGYWVEPGDPEEFRAAAMGPTVTPGMWTRRRIGEAYAEAVGRPLQHLAFAYAYGLFKIAVIIQQIHARWVRGHTHDPRFATLDRPVRVLARQAARIVERGAL
ncbi:MAG TPA: phosphotransferase family protein [Gemmatimonadales bacterium]